MFIDIQALMSQLRQERHVVPFPCDNLKFYAAPDGAWVLHRIEVIDMPLLTELSVDSIGFGLV